MVEMRGMTGRDRKSQRRWFELWYLTLLFIGGCGGPSSPSDPSYTGQWSGTTAQRAPITVTVSAGATVTEITIGHDFNGCVGTETFSHLTISIVPNVKCIPGPCSPSISSFREFSYAAGDPVSGPSVEVNGFFSATTAQGTANFRSYPGCGTAIGVGWSATKH